MCFCEVKADQNGEYPVITELFVNGNRAYKTRYPEKGTLKAVRTENDKTKKLFSPSKWVELYKEDLAHIENIEDSTINFYHYWIDEHTPIESYDRDTGILTFKYPSIFNITSDYDPDWVASFYYYLENVAQSFKNQGVWYYDRKNGKLYYIPRENEEIEEMIYATEKRLLEISGGEDTPVCDITVRNIEFFCTSTEYAAVRNGESFASDTQSVCGGHGSIELKNVHRFIMKNCTLHGTGLYAVKVSTGCHAVRIENNSFYDMGAGGISISGTPAVEEGLPTYGNVIRNNKIDGCGKRFAAGCGVLVMHSYENEISHNTICNTNYSGISVGFIWGYTPNSAYGNVISYNHIYNIGQGQLSDMEGIYLLGIQQGTVVEYNRVHDVSSAHYGGYGIYSDEGTSYARIENNVVFRTKSEPYYHHYGKYNQVKNNIFAFGSIPFLISKKDEECGICLENNILVSKSSPMFRTIFDLSSLRAGNNLVYDVENDSPTLYTKGELTMKLADWCENEDIGCGTVCADPLFADIEHDDFTLLDNSPAFEVGYKKIVGFPAKEN